MESCQSQKQKEKRKKRGPHQTEVESEGRNKGKRRLRARLDDQFSKAVNKRKEGEGLTERHQISNVGKIKEASFLTTLKMGGKRTKHQDISSSIKRGGKTTSQGRTHKWVVLEKENRLQPSHAFGVRRDRAKWQWTVVKEMRDLCARGDERREEGPKLITISKGGDTCVCVSLNFG